MKSCCFILRVWWRWCLAGPAQLSLERWLERRRDREQDQQTLQSLARKP